MPADAVDVAVVGAGPAGLAAAVAAARAGLSVNLLDEQAYAGGQVYRGLEHCAPRRIAMLGPDYAAGRELLAEFEKSGARHVRGASVWQVARDRSIDYLYEGRSVCLQARQVILCSGALERPFPIPGWTLPGVMTAGAAQILLKDSGVVPQDDVVLAGCGPLLYLLGWQYLRAGVRIRAIVDTTGPADYWQAMRHVGGALAAWPMLTKGLRLLHALKSHGVPFHSGATELAIEGTQSAQALVFKAGGRQHRLASRLVLLHQGVVPNTQFTWSLRAAHDWDAGQLCWRPRVDSWGELDQPGIFVAGDGRGIGGANAAPAQGRLAALAVAHRLGRIDSRQRDSLAATQRRALRTALRIRPFLDTLYRPKLANRVPSGATIVCRCEEVTADAILGYVGLGCVGPNQTKAFGRCGMGPCQGRLCGLTVTELIAFGAGLAPGEVGYYRIRPPIKPITLGELATGQYSGDGDGTPHAVKP